MRRFAAVVAIVCVGIAGLAVAALEASVTYVGTQTTYNLRVGTAIVSRHASLAEAVEAAKARGAGAYSVTQPTATVTVKAPTPCVYTYSAWGACEPAGKHSRTITSTSPASCSPSPQILEEPCTFVPAGPGIVSFTAMPSTVAPGGSSTLSWASTGATGCTLSAAGQTLAVPVSGNRSTGPLISSVTVRLSCNGSGGNAQRTVTITVAQPPPPPHPPPDPPPGCDYFATTRATTWGLVGLATDCKK
jgi:hypothetical protein